MLVAVALVFLIASVNVATLVLHRGIGRRRMPVRHWSPLRPLAAEVQNFVTNGTTDTRRPLVAAERESRYSRVFQGTACGVSRSHIAAAVRFVTPSFR